MVSKTRKLKGRKAPEETYWQVQLDSHGQKRMSINFMNTEVFVKA